MDNYQTEERYKPKGIISQYAEKIWQLRQSELDPTVFRRMLGISLNTLRADDRKDLPVLTDAQVEGWIRQVLNAQEQLEKKLASSQG